MQDNDESNAKPRFQSEKLFLIIKWIFPFIIGLILFRGFQQKQQNINDLIESFSNIFSYKNALKLLIVFLLIMANWACEARKWQILTQRFENLTFIDAYKSVLVGLTLGFITPANLGDFAGRTLHLKKDNRQTGIGTILLGNGIQFYVTLIFGILSYLIIWKNNISIFDQIIFGVTLFCVLLGIFLFYNRNKVQQYFNRFRWIHPFKVYLNALTDFENRDFKNVMIWTSIRFIIYSFQFVIILQIFQIDVLTIDLWAISCLILLFKTLIPPINFLSDLGIREISAIHFFNFYSVNIASVITATFALWLINILFPVLIGSAFFLRIKLANKPIN